MAKFDKIAVLNKIGSTGTVSYTHLDVYKRQVCICLAGSGLWWTATYFWRYVNYEVTNDAFVDQYVAPLNVRASGYICLLYTSRCV